MTSKVLLFLASDNNFKLVNVQFRPEETRTYTYMFAGEVQEGDFVVVPAGDNNEMKVVRVAGFTDPMTYTGFWPLKWIVQVVTMDKYNHCLKIQQDVTAELNKAEQVSVQKEMRARLEQTIGADAVTNLEKLVRL